MSDGACGFLRDGTQGVVIFDRQGLAGERCLADEKITRFNEADIGGDHVTGGKPDDIARHHLRHRHFDKIGLRVRADLAQDSRGGADHRLESLGCLAGAILLDEAHDGARHHHEQDDGDLGRIRVLAGLKGQPDIGECADGGQYHQHHDERVFEGHQELDERVRAFVMRDLVRAVLGQAFKGLGDGQSIKPPLEVGERGIDGVLRFAHRPHGQFPVLLPGGWRRTLQHHVHGLGPR